MFTTQIYELTKILDNKEFKKVIESVSSKTGFVCNQIDEYIDDSLGDKGILVIFRDSVYKKKIKVVINAAILCDFKEFSSDVLLKKISKKIKKYFNGKYQLDDFTLHKTIFVKDIDVRSKKHVSAYLKILHKINFVKFFSREKHSNLNEGSYFGLRGNSNGVEFLVYDLERILKSENIEKNRRADLESILRIEISFLKYKALKKSVNASTTSEYINEINKRDKKIFMEVVAKILPFGDFYKKDKALEIIQKEVKDKGIRRKMIRLVALIPEKKSLYLAQKSMRCNRDMDKIMKEFAKINLSPVTLAKRQDMLCLESIYKYMV